MRFPNALTLTLLGIAAINYFAAFSDLDWTWQVRTGELILEQRSVQIADHFTYTIHGQPLHDYEWLYEVGLAVVWNAFGIGGLKFLRVVLVLTPLILLIRRLSRDGVPWHGVILVLYLCIFVLAPVWNLRPLYCTTIGLLLVSGWLHEHCTGRRPLPWSLPIAMLLWANLHPGVIAGQGLLAGAIGWEVLNRFVKLNRPLEAGPLWRLTIIGSLGLAATFLSPDPIGRFQYALSPELKHPIQQVFVEMTPTWKAIFVPPFSFLPMYFVAGLTLYTIARRFREYRLWEIAYLAVLTLLANVASRTAMDWFLNMLALAVPHLCVLWRTELESPRRRVVRNLLMIDNRLKHMLGSPLFRPQRSWLVAGFGTLLAVSVIPPISRIMPMRNSTEWPVAALDFLEANGTTGNFFGPPDYGSYVNWRLKDRAKGYTDTRGFFFPPHLLEDSHYTPQMTADWPLRLTRILDEYPTDYFILETWGARGALWRSLKNHVQEPLYLDDTTVVLSADQVRDATSRLRVAEGSHGWHALRYSEGRAEAPVTIVPSPNPWGTWSPQ